MKRDKSKRCSYADRYVSECPGVTRAEALKIIQQTYIMFEQRRERDADYQRLDAWQKRLMRIVHDAREMWQQFEIEEKPITMLRNKPLADAAYAIYSPAEQILVTAVNALAAHADLVIGFGPQPGARGFRTELYRRARIVIARKAWHNRRNNREDKTGTLMRNGKRYTPGYVPDDDPVLTSKWE